MLLSGIFIREIIRWTYISFSNDKQRYVAGGGRRKEEVGMVERVVKKTYLEGKQHVALTLQNATTDLSGSIERVFHGAGPYPLLWSSGILANLPIKLFRKG